MGRYEIQPADGSRRPRKRVGRGPGSGLGKTAGRGAKGQKSRAGYARRDWFEGGQMPLQRRVPKRGFKNPFRTVFEVVNLADLDRVEGVEIDKERLAEAGLIRSAKNPVKLLGRGKIDRNVNVIVDAFSASAREAVEAAGGTCTPLSATGGPAPARHRPVAPAPAPVSPDEIPQEPAVADEATPAEASPEA